MLFSTSMVLSLLRHDIQRYVCRKEYAEIKVWDRCGLLLLLSWLLSIVALRPMQQHTAIYIYIGFRGIYYIYHI